MKKIAISLLAILMIACNRDDETYAKINKELTLQVPSNFPEVQYDLSSNQPTEKGFELGKKLFYDGKLSANGFISCGFCHEQQFAFTHHGHQFSHGINDLEGIRNAPAIQNVAFMKAFTWDGATTHLDLFPIIPITNEVEMGESITNVLQKLKDDNRYKHLFQEAFEDGKINAANFFKALSQFMVMMVSANSKYDKYVRGEENTHFTNLEKEGMQLFKQKCSQCHTSDLFTDDAFRNNGLPPYPGINDIGRAEVTGRTLDEYKFKVPSLRNVALTKPYMHDGRFGSLKAVLDFYDSGVQDSATLDTLLIQNNSLGIKLTESEKLALIAFLETLTDETYLNDKRFAEY